MPVTSVTGRTSCRLPIDQRHVALERSIVPGQDISVSSVVLCKRERGHFERLGPFVGAMIVPPMTMSFFAIRAMGRSGNFFYFSIRAGLKATAAYTGAQPT